MPVLSARSRKPRRWRYPGGLPPLPPPASGNNTPARKGARVLLRHPTKPFLIPVISIWRISVVSVTLLCNKLVPRCFHPHPRLLAEVRERYSQDTATETSVRLAKRIKKRRTVGREGRTVVVADRAAPKLHEAS